MCDKCGFDDDCKVITTITVFHNPDGLSTEHKRTVGIHNEPGEHFDTFTEDPEGKVSSEDLYAIGNYFGSIADVYMAAAIAKILKEEMSNAPLTAEDFLKGDFDPQVEPPEPPEPWMN